MLAMFHPTGKRSSNGDRAHTWAKRRSRPGGRFCKGAGCFRCAMVARCPGGGQTRPSAPGI
jgi:hypothetical protein